MQNSMVVLICSVFDRKYRFSVNLVKKIKIVSLNWNTQTYLNLQNSIVMFTFLILIGDTRFGQIWPQNLKLFNEKFDP